MLRHGFGVALCSTAVAWAYAAGTHRAIWALVIAAAINVVGMVCIASGVSGFRRSP